MERQFKKTDLMDLWLGEEVKGLVQVADVQTDSGRWESHHLFVFTHEGKHYGFVYYRGLTEMQEVDRPFEYDGDLVTVKEYVPYIVQQVAWRTADSVLPVDSTVTASKTMEPESK